MVLREHGERLAVHVVEHRWRLGKCHVQNGSWNHESTILRTGWKGDGVIARIGFPDLAKQLRALKLPVVNVSGISLPKVSFPRVVSDQVEAANMAADHLMERGFKHFAYFNLMGLEYVAEHRQAFTGALRMKGGHGCEVFEAPPQLGAEPDWNLDIKKLGKWIAGLPKPLAIFTWSSSSARELIYACMHAGLAVPEEVAVLAGSDDELFCEVTPVPISAVQLGGEQIGYRAAVELDAMMNVPGTPSRKGDSYSTARSCGSPLDRCVCH
jgi:LacI family transcriptional regulator